MDQNIDTKTKMYKEKSINKYMYILTMWENRTFDLELLSR